MGKLLAQHWPHLIFVGAGVIAFLWVAYRDLAASRGHEVVDPVPARPVASAGASVRFSVAQRGLVALGPLLGAVATGAVLYGLDLGAGAPTDAVIWVHSGISALAFLLVAYKASELGLARVRRAFTRGCLHELVSIVLSAISVPLLVTGIALLLTPSTGSAVAYLHLVSSAWWTGLMGWHLRRHLAASLRTAFRAYPPRPGGSAALRSAGRASGPRSGRGLIGRE
jgi:hypothetical protein